MFFGNFGALPIRTDIVRGNKQASCKAPKTHTRVCEIRATIRSAEVRGEESGGEGGRTVPRVQARGQGRSRPDGGSSNEWWPLWGGAACLNLSIGGGGSRGLSPVGPWMPSVLRKARRAAPWVGRGLRYAMLGTRGGDVTRHDVPMDGTVVLLCKGRGEWRGGSPPSPPPTVR